MHSLSRDNILMNTEFIKTLSIFSMRNKAKRIKKLKLKLTNKLHSLLRHPNFRLWHLRLSVYHECSERITEQCESAAIVDNQLLFSESNFNREWLTCCDAVTGQVLLRTQAILSYIFSCIGHLKISYIVILTMPQRFYCRVICKTYQFNCIGD
jgi:hypothetical protein